MSIDSSWSLASVGKKISQNVTSLIFPIHPLKHYNLRISHNLDWIHCCCRRPTRVLQQPVLLRKGVLWPAEATALRQPPWLQGPGLRQLLLPTQGKLHRGEHLLQRGSKPNDNHDLNHTSASLGTAGRQLQWDGSHLLRRPACPASPSQKVKVIWGTNNGPVQAFSLADSENLKWSFIKRQFL